jgi:hypothetical protein
MWAIVALSVALGWLLGLATVIVVRLYWSTLDRCDRPLTRRRFDTRPARPNVRTPVAHGPVRRPKITPLDSDFDEENIQ